MEYSILNLNSVPIENIQFKKEYILSYLCVKDKQIYTLKVTLHEVLNYKHIHAYISSFNFQPVSLSYPTNFDKNLFTNINHSISWVIFFNI